MPPISVLVVDTNPSLLRVLTDFLQEHSQNAVVVVGTARGATEALAQAQALLPQVILLDLQVPGLPCLEMIPRLRGMVPKAGIIALSLLDAKVYKEAALAAGADEFVGKATLGTDLLVAIRRVARSIGPKESP